MNNKPTSAEIEKLRSEYPQGTRVELLFMSDPYTKLPERAKGTVCVVDDMGTIHVSWDCGSHLGIAYGVDKCRILTRCPKCGQEYSAHPSISRRDNQTRICPECGLREAMDDAGRSKEEAEEVIADIRNLGVQN